MYSNPSVRPARFIASALAALAVGVSALSAQSGKVITPAELHLAPNFKAELIYTVPKAEQGSWVALTADPKGRLLAADQYGAIYRVTPPAIGSGEAAKVERLALDFTTVSVPDRGLPPRNPSAPEPAKIEVGAHGLLYAFDSLYVMVNEDRTRSGLWRVRDTNHDDQFDEITFLREMRGTGEHGTHSMVVGPDGKSIYFANGNHTDLPANWEAARSKAWGEDHLLPRMWDANGHAKDKYAPGGYIARTDPDGKRIELFTIGFRNQFDLAFDQNGELFTYDSDMEWDQGTPWYLPTRINHAVDGGDFGWRSGAGRWPAYYADSLPAVIDIGPGSPTGVTFGTGAKFPAKYQHALFACDWTYGTMYALHPIADGATFRAEKEEFVSGKPLPLTDLVINPHDGAMYFAIGGRRTQSAVFRVTYVGSEATEPAAIPAPTAEAKLRHSLEALHADGTGASAIDTAWPALSHRDRFIRFAARVAIEKQPSALWSARALAEKNPQAAIEALIALARVGDKSVQPQLIEALGGLKFSTLAPELRLPLLRAWELAFTRMGNPPPHVSAKIAAKLDPLFPGSDAFENRELVSLLIYLKSPTVVAKTVPLLSVSEPVTQTGELLGGEGLTARNDSYGRVVNQVGSSRPDRQQIAYAYALRNATEGWTPQLRLAYFSWFSRTRGWKGGASFDGFLHNIRDDALTHVTDPAEHAALASLSQPPGTKFVAAQINPQGPGQAYTVKSALALMPAKFTGRDFARGRAMFTSAACIICHRFNGEGGGIGPDISGAGNRYSVRDLLENIIEPSLVISDQYGSDLIELQDGTNVVGRVVGEESGDLLVMSNPFMPDEKTHVKLTTIKSRKPFGTSMMPPGLINSLNPEELKDLLAYVLSGGRAEDPMFKK
jgi:putative heme-binding domain-containing protein